MLLNLPNCILKKEEGKNEIRKLVYEGEKKDFNVTKIEYGYLINNQFETPILVTNKKDYPDYKYVIKITGNKLDEYAKMEWHKFDYQLGDKNEIAKTWQNNVVLNQEIIENGEVKQKGLRAPQIGAIHAILADWTIKNTLSTDIVVMPTGTGKTETMLVTMLLGKCERILVLVPSVALKEQISNKFITLGILKNIGIINEKVKTPNVGIINNLKDIEKIVNASNVVITTMQLASKINNEFINKYFSHLFIDEAHHMSADVWGNIVDDFKGRIVQYTATPFRNDGKIIKGKVIYNFPLLQAQEEGYFKPIKFEPLLVFDETEKDIAVAKKAIEILNIDLKNGYDHVIMARVDNRNRAKVVYEIYKELASIYNPRYIFSDMPKAEKKKIMEELKLKKCRIIICVNMLSEGFDFPEFKIAAIHDQHKTLGITLQFIGRFTRNGNKSIGTATAISNIIDENADKYLNMLYKENADWNKIINIASNNKINKNIDITEYLIKFKGELLKTVPMQNIFPALSFCLYKTNKNSWMLNSISDKFNSMDDTISSYNDEDNILVIIKRNVLRMDWSNAESLKELYYDMIIIRFDPITRIIYATSNMNGFPINYVKMCFDDAKLVSGDSIFRSLHNIKRLKLNTMGLKDRINGYISFRMYAGRDILSGLSDVTRRSVIKNNVYGKGYENGEDVTIGCSQKGKVWTRKVGTIYEWKIWCESTAKKILDDNIDVNEIIQGINAPKEIIEIPNGTVPMLIEFSPELYIFSEYVIKFKYKGYEADISKVDICLKEYTYKRDTITFLLSTDDWTAEYELKIEKNEYEYVCNSKNEIEVQMSRTSEKLSEWLRKFPPIITFDNGAKLENNLYMDISNIDILGYSKDNVIVYNWNNTNISKESQTCKREIDSIQYSVIERLENEGYDVVFDDDGKGEIADIIAIKENEENVSISLYHCKYSKGEEPGRRLGDLYEVCGQAQRSVYWKVRIEKMLARMIERDRAYKNKYGISRFIKGDENKLRIYKNKIKVFDVKFDIYIVQPGVSKKKLSSEMLKILGATNNWCQDTYMIPFKAITSE